MRKGAECNLANTSPMCGRDNSLGFKQAALERQIRRFPGTVFFAHVMMIHIPAKLLCFALGELRGKVPVPEKLVENARTEKKAN